MASLSHDTIDFLKRIGDMRRHLIGDGYDKALDLILSRAKKEGLSTATYEFPTGYEADTWIIPEKWALNYAALKDINGNILFDSSKSDLVCMSYSRPFKGKISRQELFKHLDTHPNLSHAIPFTYSYYKPNWGLCCSEDFKKTLTDDEYIVEIDSVFSNGHLKVGEIIVEGKNPESFILASHLCHPHQINDGPIGAVLGIDLLAELKKEQPNYTVRLLIVPESIGSAAWISRNQSLLPLIKSGLFIEMLTIPKPFVLNYSFMKDSLMDKLFEQVVMSENSNNRCEQFNYGNDERQFNGPGINIPMLAIHRSDMNRFQTGSHDVYPEYHSHLDNIDLVSLPELERAFNLIHDLIHSFDNYMIKPDPLFKGEPFLTRYGLEKGDISSFGDYMDIINHIGRDMTIFEISKKLEQPADTIKSVYDTMMEKGLITYKPI